MTSTDIARRMRALLDLTDLTDDCSAPKIEALCDKAISSSGPAVSALCVWPRFVSQASRLLAGSTVKVATVVNFPAGGEATLDVEAECRQALDDGADEIDMVFAYRAFIAGRRGFAETQVYRLRQLIGDRALLKVILETGELQDAGIIATAAEVAIGAGADFIKTSTGKVPINATPEAAKLMLQSIKATGGQCGIKIAGGVKTLEEAARYVTLAEEVMGTDWVTPDRFRFGASGLLSALDAVLGGEITAPESDKLASY